MKNAKKILQFPFVDCDVLDRSEPLKVMTPLEIMRELNEILELLDVHEKPTPALFTLNELNIISLPFLDIPDDVYLKNPDVVLDVLSHLQSNQIQRLVSQLHSIIDVLIEMSEYPDLQLLVPFYWNKRISLLVSGLIHPCYIGYFGNYGSY